MGVRCKVVGVEELLKALGFVGGDGFVGPANRVRTGVQWLFGGIGGVSVGSARGWERAGRTGSGNGVAGKWFQAARVRVTRGK